MQNLDALSDLLAPESRLDPIDEGIEAALAALDCLVESFDDGRRPVWRVDGRLELERTISPRGRTMQCSICHLNSITMYDPDIEAAYLVVDGRLIMINTFRQSRECSHWRVQLIGHKAQIPVRDTAKCYVTPNFNLSGLTLEEVLRG